MEIETIELFSKINKELIDLLQSLSYADFNCKTQFDSWTVKDIAAHLLDTSLRRLSDGRDNYQNKIDVKINSYNDLVVYVTKLADDWVNAFSNISPQILIEMVDKYQNELYSYLKRLDKNEFSKLPVSWAGEDKSYNWFDIAREYTERWHHQMQIREALGKPSLYSRELYYPVLDTFLKAVPYHFKDFNLEQNYKLCIEIYGEETWDWIFVWDKRFHLSTAAEENFNTIVRISAANAWKIFTRWNDKEIYQAEVIGNKLIGDHIMKMNCLIIIKE